MEFSKKYVIEIEKVGVDMRDTCDFNAEQLDNPLFGLTVWSKKRLHSKKEFLTYKTTPLPGLAHIFPGFVPARNGDFRRWQKQRNEGGDFFVFSDVMWLSPHIEYVYL